MVRLEELMKHIMEKANSKKEKIASVVSFPEVEEVRFSLYSIFIVVFNSSVVCNTYIVMIHLILFNPFQFLYRL